jgi:hypothetical protein
MATATRVELTPSTTGVYHVPEIKDDSAKTASDLLQKNHESFHIFFNADGFHNHIAHHLLAIFALGATPDELQRAYDDNKGYQRGQYKVKERNVEDMSEPETFKKFLGKEQYYTDFQAFFEKEIDTKGWQNVLKEQLFARSEHSEDMLARMFGG